MLTRKKFIHTAGACLLGMPMLQACTHNADDARYVSAVQRVWHPTPPSLVSPLLVQQELVRCATLAPSSHNTQCWKFHIEENGVRLMPDFLRRCPAVDPDDHHLFVSLGCALENMAQAALANGLHAQAFFDAAANQVHVNLTPTKPLSTPLYQAIAERQCTRAAFDGRPLANAELKLLEQAGTGDGVRVVLLTEKSALEKVLKYVVAGNTVQLNDQAFMRELKSWIRFDSREAVSTGDGLYSATSGNPPVSRWLGSRLMDVVLTPQGENDKYAKHIRSSAGIAVFVSASSDSAHWLEAGRCYQRFALRATALGIRNAMVNQAVEVGAIRPAFARAVMGNYSDAADQAGASAGARADLVVRFGRGPIMPRSLRRNLQSVLV